MDFIPNKPQFRKQQTNTSKNFKEITEVLSIYVT